MNQVTFATMLIQAHRLSYEINKTPAIGVHLSQCAPMAGVNDLLTVVIRFFAGGAVSTSPRR